MACSAVAPFAGLRPRIECPENAGLICSGKAGMLVDAASRTGLMLSEHAGHFLALAHADHKTETFIHGDHTLSRTSAHPMPDCVTCVSRSAAGVFVLTRIQQLIKKA